MHNANIVEHKTSTLGCVQIHIVSIRKCFQIFKRQFHFWRHVLPWKSRICHLFEFDCLKWAISNAKHQHLDAHKFMQWVLRNILKRLKDACSFKDMNCGLKLSHYYDFQFSCIKSTMLNTKHPRLGICKFTVCALRIRFESLECTFSFENMTCEFEFLQLWFHVSLHEINNVECKIPTFRCL